MTEYSIAALRDYKLLLDEIEDTSQRIAGSMQAIRDLYNDPSFPSAEEMGDLGGAAASVGRCLESAKETYADDRFPNEDDVAALAKSASELSATLREAAQTSAGLLREDE
jgi:hypothetical protein